MDIQEAVAAAIDGRSLSAEEMADVMRAIMTGEATPAQIGGFLVAMRVKGETPTELAAAASVMREMAAHVVGISPTAVDTCGTGGDASGLFNVSTAAAFVVAAAGGQVAKHGNRSVSSNSGSADVLELAGVRLDLTPEQIARCINEVGVGFMFAPAHHGAMKFAIGPRRELGVRTLFNLLGPLTNPAGVKRQVLGIFDADWLEPIAEVLRMLGSEHVLVIHSRDGLDEISIAEDTQVVELRDGVIGRYEVTPENFGIDRGDLDAIKVPGAEESLQMIRDVLSNQPGPARDIVQMNAGAALYVSGLSDCLVNGVTRAGQVLASGKAADKLDALVELSRGL
jgi:anthranilate phosphoribosyltransferase